MWGTAGTAPDETLWNETLLSRTLALNGVFGGPAALRAFRAGGPAVACPSADRRSRYALETGFVRQGNTTGAVKQRPKGRTVIVGNRED